MAHIICIDPGRTTGLVILDNIDYAKRSYNICFVVEIDWDHRSELRNILEAFSVDLDAIVMENFLLYPSRAVNQSYDDMPAPKVIERITVYSEQLGIVDKIHLQLASTVYLAAGVKLPIPINHYGQLAKAEHTKMAYRHGRHFILTHKNGVKKST